MAASMQIGGSYSSTHIKSRSNVIKKQVKRIRNRSSKHVHNLEQGSAIIVDQDRRASFSCDNESIWHLRNGNYIRIFLNILIGLIILIR
jgi:hypothetical protein